jgi:hypothetical protein
MPAASSFVAALYAGLATASVHGAEQAAEGKRQGEQAMRGQKEMQQKLYAEQKAEAENMEAKESANQNRTMARARQRSLSQASQGRSGTLLTGPLGLAGAEAGAKKSLLGQ